MAISEAEIGFVKELFAEVGHITTRKMFGGLSIYADKQIFALLDSNGRLHLKAADDMAKRLEAAGGCLFTYTDKNGKTNHMNYWTMPDDALDDPSCAADWARDALHAITGD